MSEFVDSNSDTQLMMHSEETLLLNVSIFVLRHPKSCMQRPSSGQYTLRASHMGSSHAVENLYTLLYSDITGC